MWEEIAVCLPSPTKSGFGLFLSRWQGVGIVVGEGEIAA